MDSHRRKIGEETIQKYLGYLSFAMLLIQNIFSNLPLFISEVSWTLTHNPN